MGESDLSRRKAGMGGVKSSNGQSSSLPSHSSARPGKTSKASFLPPGSTSIQGRLIPGSHTMVLISCCGAKPRDPAHTKSHIFPVSTQWVRAGPRAAIS